MNRLLEDQKTICLELAEKLGVKVAKEDIYEDSRSAKFADNRPAFSELICKIAKEEIDGLIAWAPDRLARNMKEAGEIIDFLDLRILKDLKFAAFDFVSDYNGKMTLGIAFVLAKQYSDKLSSDTTRGIERSFLEGKSNGQFKHGYVRIASTGFYEPDEELTESGFSRFALIQKAWSMRLDEIPLREIVGFLNDNGYSRLLKKGIKSKMNSVQPMTNQKLSSIFKDTFYYGVLKQSRHEIDLRQQYGFTSMIEEEEFHLIQRLAKIQHKKAHIHCYPFRNLIVCEGCLQYMTCSAAKGRKTYYLNFWCQNRKRIGCLSRGTIRSSLIIDLLRNIYSSFETLKKEDYNKYVEETQRFRKEQLKLLFNALKTFKRRLTLKQTEFDEFIAANLKKQHDALEKAIYLKERAALEKFIGLGRKPRPFKGGDEALPGAKQALAC